MGDAIMRGYPKAWLERIPAQIFACLLPGELRIIVFPGNGFVGGGAEWDIPMEQIPPELRIPNTPLWLQVDEDLKILRAWRRDES